MLSLDLADTAIIEIIATARIIAAIAPNSGTTTPSLISTIVEAVYSWIDKLLCSYCVISILFP